MMNFSYILFLITMNAYFFNNDKLFNDSTSWQYQTTVILEDQSPRLFGYVKVKCSKYLIKDDSTLMTFVLDEVKCVAERLNGPQCIDSITCSDTETVVLYLDEYGQCRQEILNYDLSSTLYVKSSMIDTNKIQYNGELLDQYIINNSGNHTNFISGIGIANGAYTYVYHMPCGGPPGGCNYSDLYVYELVKKNDKPVDISQIKTAVSNDFKIKQTRNNSVNGSVQRDLLGRAYLNSKVTGVIVKKTDENTFKRSLSISH